ncbi:MAG: leucine-rich repeat protein [Ruminococcus sp.]
MRKTKKLTSVLLAVIMVLGVMTFAPLTVSAATYGDFEYTLEDDYTCTITKYNGNASDVTIPSTIYGNKVTKITGFYNTDVVNVVIPKGIKEIDSYSFRYCQYLKSITLPNTLKKLRRSVFSGCLSLQSINIPDSVTYIESYAFADCSNLKNITLSKNIYGIDSYAFRGCSALNSITIPNSVKQIGEQAFSGCTNLTTVNFGSGLESIGYGIFDEFNGRGDYCKKLENITVNKNNIFFSSSNGVLFNKNETEIIWYPRGRKNTSYTVPKSVKAIYGDTFVNNPYLKEVTVYDNVKEISDCSMGYMYDYWDEYSKIEGFTIKGYKRTEAEKYARNNDFNFVALPRPVNPKSVALSKNSVTLGVGESVTLTANTQPTNAVKTLSWSSSNKRVATVSKGKITAKKSGTAYISVKTSNGKIAQCKVTVKPAPTKVKIAPKSVTLGVGEKYTVSEKTNRGSYASAANLKWTITNSEIATVTKGKGKKATITAKGVGKAYIKITLYNGKTAQCKVTVK